MFENHGKDTKMTIKAEKSMKIVKKTPNNSKSRKTYENHENTLNHFKLLVYLYNALEFRTREAQKSAGR